MPTGSTLLATLLHAADLGTIFGVVGVPVTPVAEALQAAGSPFIGMRNEQAASYAAAAYGYLRARPGCCLVVAGPGVIHALAGALVARENAWPMLLVAAGCDSRRVGQGSFQDGPQLEATATICKYTARVENLNNLYASLTAALEAACSGAPGAAYVEIAAELFSQELDNTPQQCGLLASPLPSPLFALPLRALAVDAQLTAAVAALGAAHRPLVIVGKGACLARAEVQTLALLEQLQWPALTSPMAKGLVPDDHPCSVAAARSQALAQADVVLLLGARLNWMYKYGESPLFAADVRFVQVDVCAAHVHARALPLVGDCQAVLTQLLGRVADLKDSPTTAAWFQTLRQKDATTRASVAARIEREIGEGAPLSYYAALGLINRHLPSGAVVVNEGANTMDFGRLLLANQVPRTRLDAGTNSTMGPSMGYALAAWRASAPSTRVVAVVGDSSFGFSGLEFETICRYQAPIVVIVLNNSGIYSGLRGDLSTAELALTLPPTALQAEARYDILATAFGARGVLVRTPAELSDALSAAFAAHAPVLLNVILRTDGPTPKIVAEKHQ